MAKRAALREPRRKKCTYLWHLWGVVAGGAGAGP